MAVGIPGPKKEISAERKFWLVLSDPCGLVCVIVTYFVVFFVDYMTVRNVLIPTYFASHSVVPYRYRWGMLHAGLFQCCIFMICWSHLKCMLSNPGTLPRIWPSQLLEKVKEISEIRKLQDKEYKEIGHYTKGLSVYHGVVSVITINRYTHTTVVPAKLVWKTWTTTALG